MIFQYLYIIFVLALESNMLRSRVYNWCTCIMILLFLYSFLHHNIDHRCKSIIFIIIIPLYRIMIYIQWFMFFTRYYRHIESFILINLSPKLLIIFNRSRYHLTLIFFFFWNLFIIWALIPLTLIHFEVIIKL